MRRRGKSTDLGSAVGKLVRRLDRSSGGAWRNVRASEAWPEIAGPLIAAHTGRVFLRGDELVVYVDSPVWASELTAMSEMLRERLNEALGKTEVRTIRFSVSREVSADRRQLSEKRESEARDTRTVKPVALSEDELAEVRRSVSAIENEELREAAFRATVKHLEWSRGVEAENGP